MAQCVQSVQEFIQDSFVPLVAALCSEEAEKLTRRNNLSFAELVKPFCRLTSEGWCRGRAACLQGAGEAAPPVPSARRSLGGRGVRPGLPEPLSQLLLCPVPGEAALSGQGRRAALPGAVAVLRSADRRCGGTVCRGCPRWLLSPFRFTRSLRLCGTLEVRFLLQTEHAAEGRSVSKPTSSKQVIFVSLKLSLLLLVRYLRLTADVELPELHSCG